MNMDELEAKALWVRQQALEMIVRAGHGHIGGSFSCVEILVALYHGGVLQHDPANSMWPGRDRLILSKGQACQALYAVLADRGYFPLAELETFGKEGSRLEGHPNRTVPGVEVTTGSLGNGLGIAAGMALAAKLNRQTHRVYALLGDGECYEGAVWEAAIFASEQRLDNLVAIVDANGLMVTRPTQGAHLLVRKWEAFGWPTWHVDGHSLTALMRILTEPAPGPRAIVAHTVKGKGVSFMEGQTRWHHDVPRGEELDRARRELYGD